MLDGFRMQIEAAALPIRTYRFSTDDEVWTRVFTEGYLLVNMDYSAHYLGGCVSVALDGLSRIDYGMIYRTPAAPSVRRFVDYAAAHGLG